MQNKRNACQLLDVSCCDVSCVSVWGFGFWVFDLRSVFMKKRLKRNYTCEA